MRPVAGRCEMAASLSAEELGDSFAIQAYGDLAARRAAPSPTTLKEGTGW